MFCPLHVTTTCQVNTCEWRLGQKESRAGLKAALGGQRPDPLSGDCCQATTTPTLGQFPELLLIHLVFVERGLGGLVLDTPPPLEDSGSQLTLCAGETSPRGHEPPKAASQRPSLELAVPVHLDTLSADAPDASARPAPKPPPFGVGHSAGAKAMNLKLANTENLRFLSKPNEKRKIYHSG